MYISCWMATISMLLENTSPPDLSKARWEDAYSMYYGHVDPATGELKNIKKTETLENKYAKKMKGFHMIPG